MQPRPTHQGGMDDPLRRPAPWQQFFGMPMRVRKEREEACRSASAPARIYAVNRLLWAQSREAFSTARAFTLSLARASPLEIAPFSQITRTSLRPLKSSTHFPRSPFPRLSHFLLRFCRLLASPIILALNPSSHSTHPQLVQHEHNPRSVFFDGIKTQTAAHERLSIGKRLCCPSTTPSQSSDRFWSHSSDSCAQILASTGQGRIAWGARLLPTLTITYDSGGGYDLQLGSFGHDGNELQRLSRLAGNLSCPCFHCALRSVPSASDPLDVTFQSSLYHHRL